MTTDLPIALSSTSRIRPAATFLSIFIFSASVAAGSELHVGTQAEQLQHALDARDVGGADPAESLRHVGGEQHAGADGFAVQPGRVVGGALDGVAERVAEIEQRAIAALVLVARDDFGLDLAGALDGVRERGGVARQQLRGIRSSQSKKLAVDDEPVLDDFGEAGAQLAIGQRGERVRCRRRRRRADETRR